LNIRFETFSLDSGSMQRFARNVKWQESKEAKLLFWLGLLVE